MKLILSVAVLFVIRTALAQDVRPKLSVFPQKDSRAYEENRRMLVGPSLRQPKPYPG